MRAREQRVTLHKGSKYMTVQASFDDLQRRFRALGEAATQHSASSLFVRRTYEPFSLLAEGIGFDELSRPFSTWPTWYYRCRPR